MILPEKNTSLPSSPNQLALFWASCKYIIRENKALVTDYCNRLKFWRRQIVYFNMHKMPYTVKYVGKEFHVGTLKAVLGAVNEKDISQPQFQVLHVSDFPKSGALRIPLSLNMVVPLNRSVDEIVATYAKSLRRAIKKQTTRFSYETVDDAETIRVLSETMLRPYAIARNGEAASQVAPEDAENMALGNYGAMYQLLDLGKPVGCHLGNAFVKAGKRYWHVNRFGYIESVFSDYKYLQEANSANLHLALIKAFEDGYDFCDYGYSLARPGDGLLEWKRRRKGQLMHYRSGNCVYLVPPSNGKHQFFWDNPMFSLEKDKLSLHLGIPSALEDEIVLSHYKEMGYDGLAKVYLHCENQNISGIVSGIKALYESFNVQPEIIIQPATDI